jgi:hypothetical protein
VTDKGAPESLEEASGRLRALVPRIYFGPGVAEELNRQLADRVAAFSQVAISPLAEAARVASERMGGAFANQFAEIANQNVRFAMQAVQTAMPRIMDSFQPLLTQIAKSADAAGLQSLLAQRVAFQLPSVPIDRDFVFSLRSPAIEALKSLPSQQRVPAEELVMTAQEAEQASSQLGWGTAHRSNIVLIVALLSAAFTFLANQKAILENAFKDASLAGAALTTIWQYVMAVLVLVLASQFPHQQQGGPQG